MNPPTVKSPRWSRRPSCVRNAPQAQRRAWLPAQRAFPSRTSPSTLRWLLPPFITGWTRLLACARCSAWPAVVVFTCDTTERSWRRRFWLTRDYLPEVAASRDGLATELARAIGARMEPVLVPWDCADGFFEAYWRRPEAYLHENVRRGISVWSSVGPDIEARAVRNLSADLASGRWAERNRDLLDLDAAELGLRLLIA
jgi:hypothetical protein